MGALQMALEQCYDRCEAIGTDASATYALVVLDVDSGLLPPIPRAAAMAAIASHARRVFAAGEPMAATPTGRLLVLVERGPDLPAIVRSIVATCEVSPLLAGCSRVQGWMEPLSPDRAHLDAHLAARPVSPAPRPVSPGPPPRLEEPPTPGFSLLASA
jgi:hypothetical protein